MPKPRPIDRRIITISEALIEKSMAWGRETQAKMGVMKDRKRVGNRSQSALDRGIGKMAEAALALKLGLDVESAVEWRVLGKGDGHRDLTVKINNRAKVIDVKASAHPNAKFLIWPRTQDMAKMADILVFAKVAEPNTFNYGQVFIPGFVMRQDFIRRHKMVDLRRNGDLTPVMDWNSLMALDILKNAIRACHGCERSTALEFNGVGYCPHHPPPNQYLGAGG